MMVPYIVITFIVLAFIVQDFNGVIKGFFDIQFNKSILLTDYIIVGGIGATLLNSGILMLINYYLIKLLKLKMTGLIFAGILTIGGFAFFGKNILNISIVFIGIYLYAQYKHISIKSIIIIFLFSTGIAPISSLFIFGLGIPLLYSIPLGLFVGILSGFSIVFMLVGLMLNDFKMENYKKILSKSGRAITDFTREDSYGITLINIGLTSFLVITIIIVLNIKISGPIMGAIMVVMGFSAFGKHIRNVLPSMLGVYIMSLIFGYHASNITISLAIIFSTALAPLSSEKGVVVGILSGMVHLPLVLTFSNLLGGALL